MKLKGIIEEDFLQYKEPSMFLIFPTCTFKCDIESGTQVCQNWGLNRAPIIEISNSKLIKKYLSNDITKAIVCGGLEPMDSFDELIDFVKAFRNKSNDTIVIYTGYKNDEISDKIDLLSEYKNIIIKFGRYLPGHKQHFDETLGVNLASENQYAIHLNKMLSTQ